MHNISFSRLQQRRRRRLGRQSWCWTGDNLPLGPMMIIIISRPITHPPTYTHTHTHAYNTHKRINQPFYVLYLFIYLFLIWTFYLCIDCPMAVTANYAYNSTEMDNDYDDWMQWKNKEKWGDFYHNLFFSTFSNITNPIWVHFKRKSLFI